MTSRSRRRALGFAALGVLVGAGLVVLAFYFLTRTEAGVERVRDIIVGRLENQIHGELRIGRIAPGRLLAGVTVHDIEVDDERGRPFLRVDSARIGYDWQTLLRGDIVLDRVTLYGPTIHLERLPGDESWNYERVLPGGDGPDEPGLTLLENVRIVDGTFFLRTALDLEPPVEPDDTSRLIIEDSPGGPVRVMRFESIDAEIPRILWETPAEPGSLIEIAAFATRAYIWKDPLELRELRGTITLRDSIFSFEAPHVRLPDSRAGGIGQLVFGEERTRVDVRIDGEDVAFRDLRWLYPPLPEEGGGTFTLRIETQPVGTLWLATDARLSAPGTEIAGSFGVVANDTLYFTNVDLRASPLDLALLDQVLPVDLPVDGLLVGTVIVDGPLSSLDVRGDVRLDATSPYTGTAAVRWTAQLDVRPAADGSPRLGVRRLSADIGRIDGDLLAFALNGRAVDGSMSGNVTASGEVGRDIRFEGTLRHAYGGISPLVLQAGGRWSRDGGESADGDDSYIDVTVEIQPTAFDDLTALFPQLDPLRGTASGPVHVSGYTDRLEVRADLSTSSGPLTLAGTLDLRGDVPRYELTGEFSGFRLHELLEGLPETELAGRVHAVGEGFEPASAVAEVLLDLDSALVETVMLPQSRAAMTVADGVARLDTMVMAGPAARLEAKGAFGLLAGRNASVLFRFQSDSLSALRGIFLDSEEEALEFDSPPYAGRVWFNGEIAGNLADFSVTGTGGGIGVQWDGIASDSASFQLLALGLRTDRTSIEAVLETPELRVFERRLEDATVRLQYAVSESDEDSDAPSAAGEGTVDAEARAGGTDRYRLTSSFRNVDGGIDIFVDDVVVDAGTLPWVLTSPARMRYADGLLRIQGVELARSGASSGRIRATGEVPFGRIAEEGESAGRLPLNLDFTFEDVLVAELLRVAMPDVDGAGTIDGRLNVQGTAGAPVFTAELVVDDLRHQDLRLDRLGVRLDYRNRQLQGSFSATRDARQVAYGIGRIPIDLSLTPVEQRRRDELLDIQIRADSMPLALVTGLLDGFARVDGHLHGSLFVNGTTVNPVIGGELTLSGGSAFWVPIGVQFRDANGVFRVVGNREVAIRATTRADAGRATVEGTLNFDESLADPRFDLVIDAEGFQASRRRDVEAVVTGGARLTGTYSAPIVDATLRVDRGSMNLDEIWRQYQVVELESAFLLGGADENVVAVQRRVPTNPFLRNLVGRASLSVGRDSWLRSREMNVEVAGDLTIEFDRSRDDFRITGGLTAIRGSYQLWSRRFTVSEGTVDFPGTPGIDPNLDITASYRTRAADGDPMDIMAVVSGTLQNPHVALTSDIQPPISETDLISYLLFGRPAYALTAQQSDGLFAGIVGQHFWGFASSGLETFAQTVGLDYVSIDRYDNPTAGARPESGIGGFLAGTRVEVGRYLSEISPNLFLALSQRIGATGGYGAGAGARIEWQFRPTWTAELFVEDRFARTPSFGLDQTGEIRKVWGFFLYREWGFREWRWPWERQPAIPAPTGGNGAAVQLRREVPGDESTRR
ncbi:MAG TPA: translocation/assembly module TamB domain-containing protein [Longimicrobiales bacterium]|nr:translocation/assembly module TamB domain-containing protein [Longimicrobiales bacterium]